MSKKIIRAKHDIDVSGEKERYANAHEALESVDPMDLDPEELFGDWIYQSPIDRFKLSVRVRFERTDGKVIVRRILKTVDFWKHNNVERHYWGDGELQFDEVFYDSEVHFV